MDGYFVGCLPPSSLIQQFQKQRLFADTRWVFVFVLSVPTAQCLLLLARLWIV